VSGAARSLKDSYSRPVSDDADGKAVLPKHTMAGGCQPVSRHIEARMLVVNRGGVAVGSPSSSNY
jgi:hypothetical protein